MMRSVTTRPAPRRAALLLEVIVALTILVAAMGLLSAQLVAGMKLTAAAEEETRATQLADRMLALLELDPETIQKFFNDKQSDGDFGAAHPGWFWRATVLPIEDFPGMGEVSIQILHQDDRKNQDSIENARQVRALHMIKAEPGRINLEQDFGIEQELIDQVAQSIPIPGFDPTALNPQELVSLDPMLLLQALPQLLPLLQQMGLGGAGGGGGAGGLPPALAALLGGAGGGAGGGPGGGGGGDPMRDAIRNLIAQQLGDKISPEQLDQLMAGMGQGGGGRGGFPGGGGPGAGGGRGNFPGGGGGGGGRPDDGTDNGSPPDNTGNGLSRDFLRSFIQNSLGDKVSPAELEQMLNNLPNQPGGNGGANAGGGNNAPRPPSPGGAAAAGGSNRGGNNQGNGNSNNGGRTIRDFNNQRNGGGKKGGKGA